MAKILLVSRKASPSAWLLARALRSQQHEVIFLTSYGEQVAHTQDIEFLAYFKKWNTLEATRLLPILLPLQPQIVHFVLDSHHISGAHLLLWSYAQARRSVVSGISLFHFEKNLGPHRWLRYLIQQSDIVTCPSVDALVFLRGLNMKSRKQGRTLLPPLLSENFRTSLSGGEVLEIEALLSDKKYLLRPFSQSSFDPETESSVTLARVLKERAVVLLGTQDNWSVPERKKFQKWLADQNLTEKWYLTGLPLPEDHRHLYEHAEALWLAHLDLSPFELTQYFARALETGTTVILDERQARLHAPLWRHGHNCWVIGPHSWQELLEKPSLKLSYPAGAHAGAASQKEFIDAPLNELNRLYNKALSQKAIL